MSTEKLNRVNPSLPEEVIVNILCRVPVKALIRFSSVSKRWYSLILSDPQFTQSHFKHAFHNKTLTHRLLISTNNLLQSLDPATPSFGDNSSLKTLTFPNISKQPRHCRLLGSCNGLVLVDLCEDRDLFLWNPSTRFVRKLPNPEFVAKAKKGEFTTLANAGLGYVSAADDYKIFVAGIVSKPETEFVLELFSLRANSWKRVQAPEPDRSAWFRSILSPGVALTNEALHWPYVRADEDEEDEDEEPTIMAFDLAKEEFRRLPYPIFSAGDDIDNAGISFLCMGVQAVFGGCLCVSFSRRRGGVNSMEFWVMREYGVPESWTMLFKFNKADLPQRFNRKLCGNESMFLTESGTFVLQLMWFQELIRIECHKEGNLVCSNPYIFNEGLELGQVPVFDVIKYDETLLSVPNPNYA